ncbi:hypothetical protein FGG08_001857 [Glutinoglossum americanum]|uniref:Small EDRK-rich factor-like N-terminal domain-containing protein n=1 Tax=Glutinoglossum americanum TaxID=1670608 RepID=A0A9P8L4X9_9PEZI|nr:hypothetical protein FGG08_001857 [Glutinoglossum americanum]
MARGNQREKAREKTLKEQATQKKKNTQSGTEFARTKEQQAAIMREKQAAGRNPPSHHSYDNGLSRSVLTNPSLAEAKKATEAASSSKKK